MIISVASGKGGTGKTLVATSLALSVKDSDKVAVLDCDVEEPNDHVFLKPIITNSEPVHIMVPKVAIKGGNFSRDIISPLKIPNAVPTAMISKRESHKGQPQVLKAVPPMIAAHIMTVPQDKSIPAEIMTKLTPMAIKPI